MTADAAQADEALRMQDLEIALRVSANRYHDELHHRGVLAHAAPAFELCSHEQCQANASALRVHA